MDNPGDDSEAELEPPVEPDPPVSTDGLSDAERIAELNARKGPPAIGDSVLADAWRPEED